jgi:subtilisin family serine protease
MDVGMTAFVPFRAMWRRMAVVVAVLTTGALAPPAAAARPASEPTGSYIVTLVDGAPTPETAATQARAHRARVEHVYRRAVHGYAATMTASDAAALAADPKVKRVEPDRPVHADALGVPTGVDRVDADQSLTAGIDGLGGDVDVDVAVLDSGIDAAHPDLVVRDGINCTSEADGDLYGHGTHVAGTIAARDDGVGVVGVAPGARVWSVKVLDHAGNGTWAGVICGLDWVAANASTIEVANLSLGGSGRDTGCAGSALGAAICAVNAAGVTQVVSAGNAHQDAATTVPAAFDAVITVSALADSNGAPRGTWPSSACMPEVEERLADFSNYGADVDIIAPGVCITSTWPGGGTKVLSGTSMAAPHVAGAAALYRVTHPAATPKAVRAALRKAGNLKWSPVGDPDGIQEPVLLARNL